MSEETTPQQLTLIQGSKKEESSPQKNIELTETMAQAAVQAPLSSSPKFAVTPLHDQVVVERLAAAESTGRIFIPEAARRPTKIGIVKACGPGTYSPLGNLIPMGVKPGDKVFFADYAGQELEIGAQKFLVMKETEIVGIING